MTLREIFNHVLVNSGCILLGERNVELKINDFKRIVDECVSYMNKYDPDDRKVRIQAGSSFSYRFTGNEEGAGPLERVPAWISDVIPMSSSSAAYLMNWTTVFGAVTEEIKNEFIWSYQAPDLFLDRSGRFEVHACYHHPSTPIMGPVCGPDGEKMDKEDVIDIDYPTIHLGRDPFLLMVQARFMQGVGRYRRAFTLNELPITMDASTIVDEGVRLEEQAKKAYQEDQSKFFLAFQ